MTSTRICDHCNKEITLDTEASHEAETFTCPSCGHTMQTRPAEASRVEKITTLFFEFNGRRKEAVLMDVSSTGAKILFAGRPLPANARIEVDIKEMNMVRRYATVVWSRKSDGPFSHAGLRFV
ncbi:MAG: PilZ domain-containing protein [Nitrospinota bacterium]|nr:PilZ domain-containing protein [Nitrospinota bacterium]MDH5678309.1 PilZ domain-containing protein [Nitrospinota bacterium]MDH5756135.1 PilZ domain-containing protein [Nitrospinota bacterium]